MTYVEWYDDTAKRLQLSKIPTSAFIKALFMGEASLMRWTIESNRFVHFVPKRYISYNNN